MVSIPDNHLVLVLISSLSLPLPLEDRLITLFVDYKGGYRDDKGIPQSLFKKVSRVVKRMKIGQKVLIIEKDKNPKEKKEKEIRLWLVHFSFC